jgi:hypothetical protein
MGILGTSNGALASQINNNSENNFKAMNNLLTLQDNHVEEFLLYHGEAFFTEFEKMMEDVVQRVMSQMLASLHFKLEATQGDIILEKQCLAEYQKITQENIDLDIQKILGASINQEVVYQRQMAKNQYLEAQGFGDGGQSASSNGLGQPMGGQQQPQMGGQAPANIQGQPMTGGMNQNMAMGQGAMTNTSGYPIPPSGYDNYNNPYWMDPATGQASYTAPNAGLGLGKMIQKGAAWAKWLA